MRAAMRHYRHRLLGAAFLLLIVGLIVAAIAQYNGAFTSGVPVTMRVATSGNQLEPESEVRFHGYGLGTVESINSNGREAIVHMELDPSSTDLVPANARARILPKTLIGENYVDLVLPPNPSKERLAAGDVITRDRSATAVRLETAFNNLLPVLRAVPPQQVASTMNSMATALEGRGEQLGNTLRRLERYTSEFNKSVPALRDDFRKLAKFSDTYSKAGPDAIAAMKNFSVTARTLAQRRGDLANLYGTVTATAERTRGFLAANGDNIIDLAGASRPTLELLDRYSPQYPCFLRNLATLVPKINEAFGAGTKDPGLRVTVEVTNSRGAYQPNQDEPAYADSRGPRCYPVLGRAPQYPPEGPIQDGSTHPPAADNPHNDGYSGGGGATASSPALAPAPSGVDMGMPNSPQEAGLISGLLALDGENQAGAPRWSSLLVGPLLRGSEVSLR